jgi:hypothetical protein
MVIIENNRLKTQYIYTEIQHGELHIDLKITKRTEEIWASHISCPIFNLIFIHRKNILIYEISVFILNGSYLPFQGTITIHERGQT